MIPAFAPALGPVAIVRARLAMATAARRNGLPVLRLDLDKPHGWPRHRIGLAALHIGFDAGRRYQPHVVAQVAQFTPPMMDRPTALQADNASRDGAAPSYPAAESFRAT